MRSSAAVARVESSADTGPATGAPLGAVVSRSRTCLVKTDIAVVERLEIVGPPAPRSAQGSYSPDFQVCLPYSGAFVWHVGRDTVVANPNHVLFVTGDEGYRVSQPVPGGYAELIVTVAPHVLAELLGVNESRLGNHPLFRRRSRAADLGLQRLAATCLHRHGAGHVASLESEEWLVSFLRAALAVPFYAEDMSPSTLRLLSRAKAYVSANFAAPLRLAEVARAAGASPAYLTTAFRRVEGKPLHQYLVQLRLARALVELPCASDLTALACDLGFANHSHFTATFRRAFGCTPSRYRELARRSKAT